MFWSKHAKIIFHGETLSKYCLTLHVIMDPFQEEEDEEEEKKKSMPGTVSM